MTASTSSLVFVTNYWGYTRGGINVFNLELCCAMAQLFRTKSVRVACAVYTASTKEIKDAADRGVALLVLETSSEDKSTLEHRANKLVKLANEELGTWVKWWFGHDVITGQLAMRAASIADGSKCAIFHHMNYEAYKVFSDKPGEMLNKFGSQKEVLCGADVVFAVGRKLLQSARDKTSSTPKVKVAMIVPGLSVVQGLGQPETFSAFTFGRFSPETELLKQAHLAAAAFGTAVNSFPQSLGPDAKLTVVGLSEDSLDNERKTLLELATRRAERVVAINAFPYLNDHDQLLKLLSEHSVCMMLSLHEGFGLTGWEAIAAEVPLIVSKNSGLYDTIVEFLGGAGEGCIQPVEIRGSLGHPAFHEFDVPAVASALERVAGNPEKAKSDARMLKTLVSSYFSWENAAARVAQECEMDAALPPLAQLISADHWQPHKLLDALVHSKEKVEQITRRNVSFKQLFTALRAPAEVQTRLVLFGGIATALCDKNAANEYAKWLLSNRQAKLYICYETGNAAYARARTLRNDLDISSGLPSDPVKRMEQKIIQAEALPAAIEGVAPSEDRSDIGKRVHLIPIEEPLTAYIILVDDRISLTPLFETRSTETLTFALSPNPPGFQRDVYKFISFHLEELDSSKPARLLLREIRKMIDEENCCNA